MIDCLMQLKDGKWSCSDCEWTYPLQAEEPPKRNCPVAMQRAGSIPHDLLRKESPLPTLAELIERVRRDIAERLNAERLDPELPAMMPEIVRRAAICHTNRCDKFNDQTCTDRGGACTHWVRWMERLSFGQCEQWREGT